MSRKKILLSLIIIVLIFMSVGCSNSNEKLSNKGNNKIQINTSLYVLEYFSERIGGDYVSVTNLVPPGSSPHDYEPTTKDMVKLMNGDIFVYNGAGLEGWVDKAIQNLNKERVEIIVASKGIDLMEGVDHHDGEADYGNGEVHSIDSHVWLDPVDAIKQAEQIKNGLIKKDPEHQTVYEDNFNSLKKDLLSLDTKFKNELKDTKRKEFFVSHAAFGYLTKQYGLKQYPVSGLIPSDEPSPADLAKLINKAKELNIKYILIDPKDETKIAMVLVNEIHAKTEIVDTIGSLTEEERAKGVNYFTLMEKNLEALKLALNE